jgi:hypothetical protein
MAMSHILSLLNEMRGRLGMYVGDSSLTKLASFLRGYDLAIYKCSQVESDPFLADFRDWIHQQFQNESLSWEETILRHSKDESDALKRFWELLDKYVLERNGSSVKAGTTVIAGPSERGS